MKTQRILVALLFFLTMIPTSFAESRFQLGAQAGGLGTIGDSSEAALGYGALLRFRPMTFGAIQVDAIFAKIGETQQWDLCPGMGLFLADYSEFKFGASAGLGFYGSSSSSAKVGIHYGPIAEMAMTENLSMGFQARIHNVFSNALSDHWTLMMSLVWGFESGAW